MQSLTLLRLSALLAALGTSLGSAAATYYFADCQAGADTACVAGDNANAGTSAAAPKRDLTGFTFAAGNIQRFARGGAWANTRLTLYVPASTKDNPAVFEDYKPSWGAGTAKPILKAAADSTGVGQTVFSFADGGNADRDEGYVLRNLDLRGWGDHKGKGVFVFNDADYITLDGVAISGFSIGVHVAGSNALNAGSDGNSVFFTLKNSVISGNADQGFLGGGYNLRIENNVFDNNGFGLAVRNHNLYLDGYTRNAVVRGNTLTRSAFVNGTCTAVSFVAHGNHPYLTVENNTLTETVGTGNCWGISLDSNTTTSTTPQDFTGLVIRGNKVTLGGTSGMGIGCSSCPGAVIENNVIVRTGGSGGFSGIVVPASGVYDVARGDVSDTQAMVRNNSLYIDTASSSTRAIRVAAAASTSDAVVSNLVVFGPTAAASAVCFDADTKPISAFTAFNNNLCYRQAGPATWSMQHATLAAAQAAGFDLKSMVNDPQLGSTPSATSGWLLAGSGASLMVNRGHATLSDGKDILGRSRDAAPDIGAYEWLGTAIVSPAPPANVTIK